MTDLAKSLADAGFEVISTGGSAKAIADAGVDVTPVDQITNFPEMLDGRVKTLHPAVHGGILARRDVDSHVASVTEHDLGYIDVVAVNLYPFRETVASGADFAQCVENIDIGGPAMNRAAAKNHPFVYVLVDAADYAPLVEHINGDPSAEEDLAMREAMRSERARLIQLMLDAPGADKRRPMERIPPHYHCDTMTEENR